RGRFLHGQAERGRVQLDQVDTDLPIGEGAVETELLGRAVGGEPDLQIGKSTLGGNGGDASILLKSHALEGQPLQRGRGSHSGLLLSSVSTRTGVTGLRAADPARTPLPSAV